MPTPTAPRSFDTAYVARVSAAAALAGLLFGFDTAVISGTIPYITAYFSLDEFGLGWAVGSILLGSALGALLAGGLAEWRGRRAVLFACAALFAVSALGCALAESLGAFVAFRLIGGLGVGAAAVVSPMYIAELVPSEWRGRLVSLYQLAIVTGILLSYAANYALADAGDDNWRWMFASELAPAVVFAAMLLAVPETPRWLAMRGRDAEALQVLGRVGGAAFAKTALARMRASFAEAPPSRGTGAEVAQLFSRRYRGIVLVGVAAAVFQQVTGINAILYYAPTIFERTGLDTSSSLLQTIAVGVVNVASVAVAIALVDRLGRRRLLLVGSVVMGVALAAVAACFRYGYFDHYLVLAFTLLYVGAFGCTLGAVTWVLLSEVFPNRIRGHAMAAATLALWLANFAVTYTFPIMTERLGTAATLLTYAGACALAFAFTLWKVPETKGRTLEELEAELAPALP